MASKLLLTVIFIETFSSGLLQPVFASHILSLGGTQLTMGFFLTLMFISQTFTSAINVFKSDRDPKSSLNFLLLVTGLSYVILVYSKSIWMILFSRALHTIVFSQIREYCKSTTTGDAKSLSTLDILGVSGNILGAIAGGLLFNWRKQFFYNPLLAALLTHLNIFIIQAISANFLIKSSKEPADLKANFKSHLNVLRNLNRSLEWDKIFLKTAFAASFLIFFTKYPVLIKSKFNVDAVIVGFTIAYQNILLFSINLITRKFRDLNISKDKALNACYVISICNLLAIYYVASFDYYLLLLIPLILFNLLTKEFCSSNVIHINKQSFDIDQTIRNLLNLILPIVFGATYDILDFPTFKLLFLLPSLAFSFLAINRLFKKKEKVEKKD